MSEGEPVTRGWDAINAALEPIYGQEEPRHWGPILHARIGGPDPLDGISAYRVETPAHWHFVTFGMSELYEKESDSPDVSGWGFEFTFRLARRSSEEPPGWVLNFLNNLARYVHQTGNLFGEGHHMDLNGPIALGQETPIRGIVFVRDPQLGSIATPNGRLTFLQIVGITLDELHAVQEWNSEKFVGMLARRGPLLVTDLARSSYLQDAVFLREVQKGTRRDGSSEPVSFVAKVEWSVGANAALVLGANAVRSLLRLLPRRLPYGRPFSLASGSHVVRFEPTAHWLWRGEEDALVIGMPGDAAEEWCGSVAARRGTYCWDNLPGLELTVVPSEIKDHDGKVVEVIG